MKKLMMVLAVAGLMVGCAKDQGTGGTYDQNQMNNGSSSSAPATTDTNTVNNPEQK
jgi:hypothetical protein